MGATTHTTQGQGIGTRATVVIVVQDAAAGIERTVSVRATKGADGWAEDGTGARLDGWLAVAIEQTGADAQGA